MNTIKKQYQESSPVPFHLFFISATAITILSAFILAFFYSKLAHAPLLDLSIFIPKVREDLWPKPQERFVFLTLALMIPTISFLTALTLFRGINKPARSENGNKVGVHHSKTNLAAYLTSIPVFVTTALLYFPFIGYDFSQALLTYKPLPSEHPVFVLVMTLLVATIWCVWQLSHTNRSWIARPTRVSVIVSWVIFSMAVLLQTCAWRIPNELSISRFWAWTGHAEFIFYTIGQVMAGKTLLVDLPSLYGLFPEILRPVFKLTGFSIFNFTALCAVLQILSLGSVYWVVHCSIRDSAIRISFGLALVMVTFGTILWLIGQGDPYYQYWCVQVIGLEWLGFLQYICL